MQPISNMILPRLFQFVSALLSIWIQIGQVFTGVGLGGLERSLSMRIFFSVFSNAFGVLGFTNVYVSFTSFFAIKGPLPRVYLNTGNVSNGEGYSCCVNHFDAGILTVFQGKMVPDSGNRPAAWACCRCLDRPYNIVFLLRSSNDHCAKCDMFMQKGITSDILTQIC